MGSRYRPSTPPYSRRVLAPERASTGAYGQPPSTTSYDPYHPRDRRESHTSPRSSGERVIPVSTETYRNGSLISSSRSGATHDQYNDPRRTPFPLPDNGQRRSLHQPSSSTSAAHSRAGPVIHQSLDGPSNGSSRQADRYERGGYYVTPASSSGRRHHKKTYSIDDDKRLRLVDDSDRDADYNPQPRRHDARYHLTGPSKKRSEADDYVAYEYASPREVFETTEPRRQTRRRGSVDAPSRDRPTASMNSYAPSKPRPREIGPPAATKALERINGGGVSRHESLRDQARSPPRNTDRRSFESHSEDDDYYVAPRRHRDRPEPPHREYAAPYSPTRSDFRRPPLTASHKFEDTDVANRGFGIRAASVDPADPREEGVGSKGRYITEQRPPPPPDYPAEARRGDRKRDTDARQRDRGTDPEREGEIARRKDRDRDGHPAEESGVAEDELQSGRRDKAREGRRANNGSVTSGVLPALAAGTAAAAAGEVVDHKKSEERRDKAADPKENDAEPPWDQGVESPDETSTRERHYITKDDQRDAGAAPGDDASPPMDPDEEFRLRVQQEANRAKQSKAAPSRTNEGTQQQRSREEDVSDVRGPRKQRAAPNDLESGSEDGEEEDRGEEDTSGALTLHPESHGNVLGRALTNEPVEIHDDRESRVRIVEPPKEKEAPRGILRKPTEKFPEYADAVREGVAPHKNNKKEGIPEGAKWTKISRVMVNPQALKEAEERFEEREDFVIVLRAISRDEIQKLADRTQEIRDERDHRYHRDRRHRRRDYDDGEDDYYDH